MEWLQTYKIGKALLESENFEPVDAYFQNYKPSKRKVFPYNVRNTQVLSINIDLQNNLISSTLEVFDPQRIKTDNFFTSVSGNFTSYYLCSSYKKITSILDFFSEDFEKEYKKLIKEGLLNFEFQNTSLLKYRQNCLILYKELKSYIETINNNIKIHNLNLGEKGVDEISFVVTKVIDIKNNEIYLNTLPEYREFCYKRFLSLAKINSKTEINNN